MLAYKSLLRLFALTFVLFALVIQTPSAQGSDPVKTRLNGLGVTTTETDRPIPNPSNPNQEITVSDDYAPLGKNYTINEINEIGLFNLGISTTPDTQFTLFEDQAGGGNALISNNVNTLHPQLANYQQRYVTYGDIDADGFDEIVIAYRVPKQTKRVLHLQVLNNIETGTFTSELIQEVYVEAYFVPTPEPTPDPNQEQYRTLLDQVEVSMGDINNDDKEDLVVAICCQSVLNSAGTIVKKKQVEMRAYQFTRDGTNKLFALPITPFTKLIDNQITTRTVYPELATGNIDDDNGMEVAVVLNEREEDLTNNASTGGYTSYLVMDDYSENYSIVKTERVPAGEGPAFPIIANVAIGDVDADGYDEILLAGITNFIEDCNALQGQSFITIEDKMNNFVLGAAEYIESVPDLSCGDTPGAFLRLRYLHMNTLDLNGDNIPEVHVNGKIFGGWFAGAPWTMLGDLGTSLFFNNTNQYFLRTNSAMTVGDYSGDGRDDIIVYSPVNQDIRIYGIPEGVTNLDLLDSKSVASSSDTEFNPILIAPNVDKDTTVLRYIGHQQIFTEPIPIAVIAAAPCDPDWGQDPANCTSSIGFSETTGGTTEESFTMSASATVGYTVESLFATFALTLEASLETYLTKTQSETYTRTVTVTYEPGSLEDTIVFTSIPIDRYTYALVTCNSDAPYASVELCEPEDITETTFNVDLPRTPRTLQTTIDVYNAFVPVGEAVLIDSNIFGHVPGDPTSYPSRAEAAELITSNQGFQVPDPAKPPLYTGNTTGGSVLSVELSKEVANTSTYGANFSFDFSGTAGGVMLGFGVGYGVEKGLTIITGSSTLYSGKVSDHSIPDWLNYSYGWGMFSYVYTAVFPDGSDPDTELDKQQFQVLNFWTVPPTGGWEATPTYTALPVTPNGTPGTPVPATPTLQPTPDGAVELLVNTSFENYDATSKQPADWAGKNVGTENKIKCNKPDKTFANSGSCAYQFKGTGAKVKLQQTITEAVLTTNGAVAGDLLRAALYASGKNLSAGGAAVKVKITYTDTTAGEDGLGKDKIKFNLVLGAVNVYQPFEQSLPFDAVPNSIKVQVQFKSLTGKLTIDDASVSIPEDTGSSLVPLPLGNNGRGS